MRLPDGRVIDYLVDGFGHRIAKKVNGILQKQWVYGKGLAPLAELDGTGALKLRFIYGSKPNVPDLIKDVSSGKLYRVFSDQLGTPLLIWDMAGNAPLETASFDEFGNKLSGSNAVFEMPFGFAGGLYDKDTKLTRFGARDYDPSIGRWTSKDPVRFDGGVNLYAYVGNDPVNRTDPLGKWYEPACKLGVMAGYNRGCQRAATRTAKMMCSFMCSQAGQYMFCDWKEPGEPEPADDGGMCSSPDPEPEPQPEPPCDPSNSSCG